VCDDKLTREFPLLMLLSFMNLKFTAVFDKFTDGISHTFPVHHSTKSFVKSYVSRVLKVVVVPTNCMVLKSYRDDHQRNSDID